MNDLVPARQTYVLPASERPLDASAVLAAWRSGKNERTLQSYGWDLDDFAAWCGLDAKDAAGRLLSLDSGRAHEVALGYLEHLQERGLAPATCCRRIAALKSLAKAARLIGMVNWVLELPTPKAVPFKDTRGPGRDGFLRLVHAAEKQAEPLRSRNLAILWLLYGRALRRSEAVGLRFPEDVDLDKGRLYVLGKHRREREWATVPPATVRALKAWIERRGAAPGPLFFRLDPARQSGGAMAPLTGLAVQDMISSLGDKTGQRARPHGLRHAAITDVLDVTRGDYRKAQRFGRLRSANVLRYYDDNREDAGGDAAKLIAP